MSSSPITEVRLTGCTTEQVRTIAAMLSRSRGMVPGWNNCGSIAPPWAPIVHCEGVYFTVITPKVPVELATRLLSAVSDPDTLSRTDEALSASES
jgi:hypothetical protein